MTIKYHTMSQIPITNWPTRRNSKSWFEHPESCIKHQQHSKRVQWCEEYKSTQSFTARISRAVVWHFLIQPFFCSGWQAHDDAMHRQMRHELSNCSVKLSFDEKKVFPNFPRESKKIKKWCYKKIKGFMKSIKHFWKLAHANTPVPTKYAVFDVQSDNPNDSSVDIQCYETNNAPICDWLKILVRQRFQNIGWLREPIEISR